MVIRPSGRRSNDHWSPLDKPKIRKIRKIRDLIIPLFRVSMVNQNFIPKEVGQTKIFKYFWWNDFRFAKMIARRVLCGFDSAAESSLSAAESEADSKGLIRAPHHCKSIFHLFKK